MVSMMLSLGVSKYLCDEVIEILSTTSNCCLLNVKKLERSPLSWLVLVWSMVSMSCCIFVCLFTPCSNHLALS